MADVDTDLPRAQLKRIVKGKLGTAIDGKEISLASDALLAFSESAKVFISYLSACANDICKESKRQTISADDVFKALEELEFEGLVPALKEFLEVYKKAAKEKSAAAQKKRKATDDPADGAKNEDGKADDEKGGDGEQGEKEAEAEEGDNAEEVEGEGNRAEAMEEDS